MKFNLESIPAQLINVKIQKGLKVVKYARKVFYDNLWDEHPLLRECRGLVLDMDNNIVAHPFTKVDNIGQNNTVLPEFPFTAVDKVNGFMGTASYHEGEILASTTGSLESDFVSLIEEYLDKSNSAIKQLVLGGTIMFEICSPKDPHIVPEEEGIYLIGYRNHCDDELVSEELLDTIANLVPEWKRPVHRVVETQEQWNELLETKMEGYMLIKDGNVVGKLKSSHYLGLKYFARCGKNKAAQLWKMNKERLFLIGLEEEFFGVLEAIRNTHTEQEWLDMLETERLDFIKENL